MSWNLRAGVITFSVVLAGAAWPASAGTSDESCYVSIVRLKDAPAADYPDGQVYVQVYIGASRLFETPCKPLTAPGFTNRITFSTAKSMPIRLVARIIPGADATSHVTDKPRPPERQTESPAPGGGDEVLGEGFEGLIGDYDIDDTRPAPAARPPDVPSRGRTSTKGSRAHGSNVNPRGIVYCDVSLDWPPLDGIHSLACGAATLEIRTEMIRR